MVTRCGNTNGMGWVERLAKSHVSATSSTIDPHTTIHEAEVAFSVPTVMMPAPFAMPLHPQAKAFLNSLAAKHGPSWTQMSPAEARTAYNSLTELIDTGPDLHHIEDCFLHGKVPARIYRPSTIRPLPVVMYFHGGGWELGNIGTHDTLCRRLAQGSGCAIVSVDYRLAPEHPFPAALDDCCAATRSISENAADLGFDPNRIAVCGDSAGGNLAACTALKLRDEKGPKLHSQWLIYPVIEANFETGSYQAFAKDHGLTRAEMQWFWSQYVPKAEDRGNPCVAPIFAESLAGLPPAHILTAEYDVLRDEGEAYAARLKAAGVPVTLQRYDGMLHGFVHFCEPFDDGKRAVNELAYAIKEALNP
jgi:acetyl esterase